MVYLFVRNILDTVVNNLLITKDLLALGLVSPF